MNIKRFTASILLLLQLSSTTTAFAEPPKLQTGGDIVAAAARGEQVSRAMTLNEPDIGAVISPLRKGQIAPYTGTLFSPRAAGSIITQIDAQKQQIIIEVQHAREVEQANCTFKLSEATTHYNADKKISDAKLEERNKRIVILSEQLKQEENNRTNTSLWVGLGAGGGFIVGVGITVLTIYAVNVASK
jgi:hypothetical protein